jgi:deoxyribodipyrimidine photo-lyase
MMTPTILWFRRDLRLQDHTALTAAIARGGAVIAVFICDAQVESLGAAPKWRLGLGIEALQSALAAKGNRLILRRGSAFEELKALVAETGARTVYWQRAYDPTSQERDAAVKAALLELGVEAQSFKGHLLFEPWTVQTKVGGFFKVYTPMWNSVRGRDVPAPLPEPAIVTAPEAFPASDNLADWRLGRQMQRGGAIVAGYARVGAAKAMARLEEFTNGGLRDYRANRDIPGEDGTSKLAENLALGEITPAQCWHVGQAELERGNPGAETFLKELVWREFAYHLLHHTPQILNQNWKPAWDAFPWSEDSNSRNFTAWKMGQTGLEFIDAAMRELYVTGTMHNRGRMIVASYLTKHLMTHWRLGQAWFEDCLIDWDPASNAMGWQWAAGSGPDAAPYFRVFNPESQIEKFDADRRYRRTWIAEGQKAPPDTALQFYAASPVSWNLSPKTAYPQPIVTAKKGREIALSYYQSRAF